MRRGSLQRCVVPSLAAIAAASLAACTPSPEQLAAEHGATVSKYCTDCHSAAEREADLVLENPDLPNPAAERAKWEAVVHKLSAGLMPPPGQPRPSDEAVASLVSYLETTLDADRARAGRRARTPADARGVRQCGSGLARLSGRRRSAAARGHHERRLRQRLRYAEDFAAAARALPHGRVARGRHGGGRHHALAARHGVPAAARSLAERLDRRAAVSARAAGSSSITTSRPTPSTRFARSCGERRAARCAESRGSRRPSSSRSCSTAPSCIPPSSAVPTTTRCRTATSAAR